MRLPSCVTIVLSLAGAATLSPHVAAQCPIEPVHTAPFAEFAGIIRAMTTWDPDGAGPAPAVMVVSGWRSVRGCRSPGG